jgi:exodeoxyribonuclease V beta subunit
MQTGPRHFDVCEPLPGPGVTILEASAGTGKTFTVAALVARLVAEGAPLSDMLVVTFTRMATGELRDRVRERLVSAEAALGRYLDGGSALPADDAVVELLAEGGPVQTSLRRDRLADALGSFDTATITTTHGFCHMVLAALGVWGEVADGATLLEDQTDLVEDVVDDLLVRHALRSAVPPFRRRAALEVAFRAVENPGTPLDPEPDMQDASPSGLRRRLAEGVRRDLKERLLDANFLTYDGLLDRLLAALSDEKRGEMARRRLRERYRVVLVDEFQDTDSVQWKVVQRAFADGATRLVLIGDPKQAVYSFRGADVYAYLEAAREAEPGQRFTLEENWRSDASLLAAYDALFQPLHLGHPEIQYRTAHATQAHQQPGLEGAPVAMPLRARFVPRRELGLERISRGLIQKDAAVRFVAEDLAADVVRLLESGAALVREGPGPEAELRCRPVGAGDIGVLVRTNRQATVVQSSLRAVGVPVVVAGVQSVLSTPAAHHWLRLLSALEQPTSRSFAAATALTPFVGMTAEELALADEKTWEELHSRLHNWSALLRQSGVATLFAHVLATEGLPDRLLRVVDGERQLTDLGHIAELLHAEAGQSQLGLAALRAWLARRTDEAGSEGAEAEQRSRRLDSDAAAVQVLTVHRAKGLEFPVVYCPYLWDAGSRDRAGEPVVFHDAADGDRRKLDVGGDIEDFAYEMHYNASKVERRGEDLRHLYVALTRAKHQAVIWWAGVRDCQHSALGRLLLMRGPSGDVKPSGRPSEPKDEEVEAELRRLAARAPGLISVEHCTAVTPARLGRGTSSGPPPDLSAAFFGRHLDLEWRRSSYTSITALAHTGWRAHGDGEAGDLAGSDKAVGDAVGSEPEEPGTIDEPLAALADDLPTAFPGYEEEQLRSVVPVLGAAPAGAEFGTFVHSVLERADFAAADLRSALLDAVHDQQDSYLGGPLDAELLAEGLEAALLTPLDGWAGGARLRDLSRSDRLDELGFELPVAGGDDPTGEVLLSEVARLIGAHLPPGEPLAGYSSALTGPELVANLRGYLTGSLDLVFRLGQDERQRYFVADYKTNWLAPPGEELTAWHYRPAAMEAEMRRAHYPLQAILYMVALHRYLRWRLPRYSPEEHLGGAVYLFVRGMVGPGAPRVEGRTCGVFSWRPPAELVVELSDLLAGRAPGSIADGP